RRRAGERGCRSELRLEGVEDLASRAVGQCSEYTPKRRSCDTLERVLFVRVAAQRARRPRMVQHERDADHGQPARERTLESDAEMPALRGARLEQGVRTRCTKGLLVCSPE